MFRMSSDWLAQTRTEATLITIDPEKLSADQSETVPVFLPV